MTSTSADQSSSWAVWIEKLEAHAVDRGNADNGCTYRPSVCRVPSVIKALKPRMYQHQVLSLGLYDRDFVNMAQKLQLGVVGEFLNQMRKLHPSEVRSWDDLCECVAGPVVKAEELRQFYRFGPGESSINIESTTARSMLTFDAVFLTVFFLVLDEKNKDILPWDGKKFVDVAAQVGLTPYFREQLYEDIFLFENQIPLRLVRQVWNQIVSVEKSPHNFNTHIRGILLRSLVMHLPSRASFMSDNHISFVQCDHLLHCLYIAVCRTRGPASDSAAQSQSPASDSAAQSQSPLHRSRRKRSLPTATELRKAGVKFRGSGEDTSVSQIRLEKSIFSATLYLPQIDIHDKTEMILRNLFTFEMMSNIDSKILSYLIVMDDLVNTADDVRLLMKGNNPVIGVNNLGSDNDIAELFNGMNKNVTIFCKSAKYARIREEVNDWCEQKTRQSVIRFVHRFFDRPWILVSLIAATVLLVMTTFQTVYTVTGFYQPKEEKT